MNRFAIDIATHDHEAIQMDFPYPIRIRDFAICTVIPGKGLPTESSLFRLDNTGIVTL